MLDAGCWITQNDDLYSYILNGSKVFIYHISPHPASPVHGEDIASLPWREGLREGVKWTYHRKAGRGALKR
jgi:hypothetical protein